MRALRTLIGMMVACTALAPLAAADNDTIVDPPDNVDVNVRDNDPDESVGFAGLSGTALIVLVVLAVIVVALIVALASRDRYP